MSISIALWYASIGLFYVHVYEHFRIKLSRSCCDFKVIFLLLQKNADVEINPGPKKKETRFFSCLHWNVNSILAYNKQSLLEAYNTIHQYNILSISEIYLDSSVSLDNTTLSISCYNFAWSDHPSHFKRDGICLYYKEKLSFRIINVSFLSQCVM